MTGNKKIAYLLQKPKKKKYNYFPSTQKTFSYKGLRLSIFFLQFGNKKSGNEYLNQYNLILSRESFLSDTYS